MPNYSKNEVVLVRYPFSDLSASKIRPAIIVSTSDPSQDIFIVPLTSRNRNLLNGEFILADWKRAGLNVPSTIKRGLYTIHGSLIIKSVGNLAAHDIAQLEQSLRTWLGLK